MEDYGRPFMCHAGVSAAFFILKLPGNVLLGVTAQRVPDDGKEAHRKRALNACCETAEWF